VYAVQEKIYLKTNFQLLNKMVANCKQNNHQIRFWLLKIYKNKSND